ncbi:MAG: hypothetical protein IPJ85_08220 [Flavobacteriales bacterium]|nr:hypothetical protein [Flavobacteriales bacterium]
MKTCLSSLALALVLLSCNNGADKARLCVEYFEPYADLVSNQMSDSRSSGFVAAMDHYSNSRYKEAEQGLADYIASRRDFHKSAYLYLAVSQLANGKPYDAELAIDKLEHSSVKGFADQCEWYTVLCWVCSEQWARALEGAQAIAASPRHAYKKQAAKLAQRLERISAE